MRKISKAPIGPLLADQFDGQTGALRSDAPHQIGPCGQQEQSNEALAAQQNASNIPLRTSSGDAVLAGAQSSNQHGDDVGRKGGETAVPESARGGNESASPIKTASLDTQSAVLCGALGRKEANQIKAQEVTAYLNGFRCVSGSVDLIQRYFFRNQHQWGISRLSFLADKIAKAQDWEQDTIPAFDDPLPSGEQQARMWRLTFKAEAMAWEHRLLKAHLDLGDPDPAHGYCGLRVYWPATDTLAGLIVQTARKQMSLKSPGTWHGRHLLQLAEADYVVVVDHPSVRYSHQAAMVPA